MDKLVSLFATKPHISGAHQAVSLMLTAARASAKQRSGHGEGGLAAERRDGGLAEAPRGSRALYSKSTANHPFAVDAADGVEPAGPNAQALPPSVTPARIDRNDRASGLGSLSRNNADSRDLLNDDLVREISAVKPTPEGGMLW